MPPPALIIRHRRAGAHLPSKTGSQSGAGRQGVTLCSLASRRPYKSPSPPPPSAATKVADEAHSHRYRDRSRIVKKATTFY